MDDGPDRQVDRLHALDGWRAISVMLVVAYHLQRSSTVRFEPQIQLGDFGVLGVEFFFGISGFVICRRFIQELSASGRVSLRTFYLRRVLRIVPPLVLYVLTVALLARGRLVPAGSVSVLRALSFTCNFPGASCGGYLGAHMWSLSVEEQFYLLIPVLFVVLGPSRRRSLTGLACLLPLVVVTLYALSERSGATFMVQFVTIGCGVACALHEDRIRGWLERVPGVIYPIVLFALFARRGLPASRLSTVLNIFFVGPAVLLILMGTSLNPGPLRRILSSAPLLAVGRVSYSLYLWQQLATDSYPGAGAAFYAVTVGLTVLLAFGSYAFLEAPLIALGRAFLVLQGVEAVRGEGAPFTY